LIQNVNTKYRGKGISRIIFKNGQRSSLTSRVTANFYLVIKFKRFTLKQNITRLNLYISVTCTGKQITIITTVHSPFQLEKSWLSY